jgi:hypothetical protein
MHPRTLELLNYLEDQRAVLKAAFDSVPLDLRAEPPIPGRWSAAGVVEHVAIVEGRVAGLLSSRIAEARAEGLERERHATPILPTIGLNRVLDRTGRLTAPDVVRPSGVAPDAAWDAVETAGAAIRRALHEGDGLALGSLTAPHPLFGSLSFYEWFAFVGAHEARHAAQIREDYAPLRT